MLSSSSLILAKSRNRLTQEMKRSEILQGTTESYVNPMRWEKQTFFGTGKNTNSKQRKTNKNTKIIKHNPASIVNPVHPDTPPAQQRTAPHFAAEPLQAQTECHSKHQNHLTCASAAVASQQWLPGWWCWLCPSWKIWRLRQWVSDDIPYIDEMESHNPVMFETTNQINLCNSKTWVSLAHHPIYGK